MDKVLLPLFCIFAILHIYPIRRSLYILCTEGLNVINAAHGILLLNTVFPFLIGDFLIILSVTSDGTFNVSLVVKMLDFISLMTFNAYFIHVFEYRETLIYKGVAHRFYNYVYRLLLFKVLSVPLGWVFGLMIASALNYDTTAFYIIYESLVALGTAVMYFLLKYKFESLDIIPSQVRNGSKAEVVIQVLRNETNTNTKQNNQASKKSVKERYEEVKLDIYENLIKNLFGTSSAVILAIILLSVFRNNSSFKQYYLSIHYRLVLMVPFIVCSEPIMKSCIKKRKKLRNNSLVLNNIEAEDDIFGGDQ